MTEMIVMQENNIGETFEYEGKVLLVKKSNIHGCFKCVFGNDDVACHRFRCTPGGRKDGKFVHFEEVNPDEVKKKAAKAKKATTKKATPKKSKTKKVKTKEVKNGR